VASLTSSSIAARAAAGYPGHPGSARGLWGRHGLPASRQRGLCAGGAHHRLRPGLRAGPGRDHHRAGGGDRAGRGRGPVRRSCFRRCRRRRVGAQWLLYCSPGPSVARARIGWTGRRLRPTGRCAWRCSLRLADGPDGSAAQAHWTLRMAVLPSVRCR